MSKLPSTGHLTGRAVEEWVGRTADSKPPQAVYDRLFLRQMGRDAITGSKIMPGDKTQVDHIVPLKDGGANRETNLQIILAGSHKEKTRAENSARAKERRIRLKHFGLWAKSSRPLRGRGFHRRHEEMDPDT